MTGTSDRWNRYITVKSHERTSLFTNLLYREVACHHNATLLSLAAYGPSQYISLLWEYLYLGKTVFILRQGPGVTGGTRGSTTSIATSDDKVMRILIFLWMQSIEVATLDFSRYPTRFATTSPNQPVFQPPGLIHHLWSIACQTQVNWVTRKAIINMTRSVRIFQGLDIQINP